MQTNLKIARIAVHGLHDSYNYAIDFPDGTETIILIAPNGFGKTALLSLINECLSLDLVRAAKRVFESLEVQFKDGSKWVFVRKSEEAKQLPQDEEELNRQRRAFMHRRGMQHPYWIDLLRFDAQGQQVEERLPELTALDRRAVLRTIERTEPWLLHLPESDLFHTPSSLAMPSSEAFERYFHMVSNDENIRKIVSTTNPGFVWPSVKKLNTLFIETQRLLYQEQKSSPEDRSPSHREEILRQADRLSSLLRESYGEYASTSQALDRTFPNRLIERAQAGELINEAQLKAELASIEQKRQELTDVGILVDQVGPIAHSSEELVPQVLHALQIYVEDSKKKLAIYDKIFPKIEVFIELVEKKLSPKKIIVSREDGAILTKDGSKLDLTTLSSGEKHEFIMLFKLAFETIPGSLVLIDEPEISLHVVWQLEFMSDLARMQAANPFQCIIATHSPQIFQGHKHLVVDLADQAQ